MADHKLSLSANRENRKRKDSEDSARAKAKAPQASKEADQSADIDTDDSDILSGIPSRGENKNNMLFIVVGVAVVIVVVFVFILFFMGGKQDEPTPMISSGQSTGGTTQQTGGNIVTNSGQMQTSTTAKPTDDTPVGVGTQDFSQNTTMQNSDVLTNPDEYIEDIYGLTVRVDYTVSRISDVADFVSYEKHRGTWGGGLELYWLDAEYKGKHYVIQVPFKYYKELDDTGIVPVKMEVLSIDGSSADETLTVISYMCLDEEVLEDILKGQAKVR